MVTKDRSASGNAADGGLTSAPSQTLIGLASDHGGRILKEALKQELVSQGFQVKDFGVPVEADASVDYPDYATALALDVSAGSLARGILVCGTGIGMCITANKFPGVRAASAWDEYTARMAREHNDANVLCLGERALAASAALAIARTWLSTAFAGGRHAGRVQKIKDIESRNFKE